MSRFFTTCAVLLIVAASLTGCAGGSNEFASIDTPVSDMTDTAVTAAAVIAPPALPPASPTAFKIVVTTPTSGGPVAVQPAADGFVHLQAGQMSSYAATTKDGVALTGCVIVAQLPGSGAVKPYDGKTMYRFDNAGKYAVAAFKSGAYVVGIRVVVDPVDLSKVTFKLTERVIYPWVAGDFYTDVAGTHFRLGTKFVFEARFYNSLVPGLWTMPGTVSLRADIATKGPIVPDGSGYKAVAVGSTTANGAVRVFLSDGRSASFNNAHSIIVFR